MAKSRKKVVHRGAIDCGCDVAGPTPKGRKAAGVDPEIKAGNLVRLKRIEGQIRGLQKMVELDRYCPEILMQLSAVQEALRGVGRELMRNHLRHCVSSAVRAGGDAAVRIYDELVELFHKSAR